MKGTALSWKELHRNKSVHQIKEGSNQRDNYRGSAMLSPVLENEEKVNSKEGF